MEDNFIEVLDEIIDIIENNEHNSYYHNSKTNKFHIIDKNKYRTIDLEAKLGINSFYLKDNVLDFKYIYSKRYLDDTINMQQIYLDDGYDKKYYCFLENDTYVNLVACSCMKNNSDIICKNNLVFGKNSIEILNYAKKSFEQFLEEEKEKYDNSQREECEEEYDDEFDEDYYDEEDSDYENTENLSPEDEMEEDETSIILQIYKDYELKIDGVVNNNEIKSWLITELETDIEHAFYNSILIKSGIENLKMVVDAARKKLKDEKIL